MAEDIKEKTDQIMLDFSKLKKIAQLPCDVIPVAVQDYDSKEVLMVCYINEQALRYSIENKIAAFWSTSKNQLHIKGQTSGNKLQLMDIRVNCEQNSLLFIVRLLGDSAAT